MNKLICMEKNWGGAEMKMCKWKEFDVIEKNMELISNFPDIESVSPMTHTLDDFEFVLRDDIPEESPNIYERKKIKN